MNFYYDTILGLRYDCLIPEFSPLLSVPADFNVDKLLEILEKTGFLPINNEKDYEEYYILITDYIL